ncbi:MAG: phosphatase PAP2 family protein [Pedobacter sp.]|nr:phosphatase PAP2 family protein [Pedobacter sp.]
MPNKRLLLIALLLLTLSFVGLILYVMHEPIPKIDQQISLILQNYHADWLDNVMLAISFFGELPYSLLMVLCVAIVFFRYKYRHEAFMTLSILLSGLLILAVKNLVNRPRPTQFYVRLVEINRFQSFPSGHVLSYVLFFGFMVVLMRHRNDIPLRTRKWVTYISLFYLISISFSRIYLGAHWFTDTLGGFILGLICLIVLCYFYFRYGKRFER